MSASLRSPVITVMTVSRCYCDATPATNQAELVTPEEPTHSVDIKSSNNLQRQGSTTSVTCSHAVSEQRSLYMF